MSGQDSVEAFALGLELRKAREEAKALRGLLAGRDAILAEIDEVIPSSELRAVTDLPMAVRVLERERDTLTAVLKAEREFARKAERERDDWHARADARAADLTRQLALADAREAARGVLLRLCDEKEAALKRTEAERDEALGRLARVPSSPQEMTLEENQRLRAENERLRRENYEGVKAAWASVAKVAQEYRDALRELVEAHADWSTAEFGPREPRWHKVLDRARELLKEPSDG